VPIGLLLGALGLALLTQISPTSGYALHILVPTLILALGMGITFASAPSNSTLGVDPEHAGVASALFNVMQQVGGSVGTALLNTLAASAAASFVRSHATTSGVQGLAAIHSYTVAFWWAAGITAGAAVLCAIVFRSGVPQVDPENRPVGVM